MPERMTGVVSALGVTLALVLAVFYHGTQMPLLAAVETIFLVWIVVSLLRRYSSGIDLPRTPLSVSLTLFWAWLGLTLLWNPVSGVGAITFWWVGTAVLAFWAYTLAPDRERVWARAAPLVLAGGIALCGYALVQVFAFGLPPRAMFYNIHSFAALLVLLSLPAAGHLLIVLQRGYRGTTVWGLGTAVFVLWFTVAATQGRGTTISLVLGLAVLLALSAPAVSRQHVLTIVGMFVAAYAGANLALHGALTDRFATLSDPASAAFPRLLIWRGSWEMVQDRPWFGIGLGNYHLAWPPYRDPADTSLGFFAHNDYLQVWIEAGLPGLLLLLAAMMAVVVMSVRLLRRKRLAANRRIETAGLVAGLSAIAAHSFLDFNLYILPISAAAGLSLGRWHEIVTSVVRSPSWRMLPSSVVRRPVYSTVVVMVALLPLAYFVALAASDIAYRRALALASAHRLPESNRHFAWAEMLMPSADRFYVAHADLYRFVLSRTPLQQADHRRAVFEASLDLLNRAQALNPYRAIVHDLRGRLYQGAPELVGDDWRQRVATEYQRALTLNPLLLRTRLIYADLLLSTEAHDDARALLDAGVRYHYAPDADLLVYYEALERLLRDAGATERAHAIRARRESLLVTLTRLAPARSPVDDIVALPTTGSIQPSNVMAR